MIPAAKVARTGAMLGALLALAALPAPAAAQFSDSYKFLEAVRKKDGQKVTDALAVPGTQVINTRDVTSGQSPIHIVTEMRDITWMSFLLSKGANPNAHDRKGVTPLEISVRLGFPEGAKLLLDRGARVNEANATGETPLITAVLRRDTVLTKLLLAAGANPDRPDNSGRSARDYARAETGNAAATEVLNAKAGAKGPTKSYGPSL